MYDAGLISFVEPFITLKNQGVLMSPLDGKRMSKSRGNVVTPDEVVAQVGADALRLYVVFLGPFEADVLWDGERIRSMTRFLERIWRLVHNPPTVAEVEDVAFEQERHRVVQRLTDDMERFRFNTAVAALMEYLNYLTDVVRQTAVHPAQWQRAVETFTLLLAPFAPFMAEEVWRGVLGQASSVHRQMWPVYDEAMLASAEVVLVVQVNGKVRDRLTVPAQISQETMEKLALNAPNVRRYVNGKPVQRVIVVGNKVVNVVV
jgi:leucyl-tRNA synthetase